MDNDGPEMTAKRSRTGAEHSRDGVHRARLPVAEPVVESFHSRVRDELLDVEEFAGLAEAQVVVGDWREDYNRQRHSGSAPLPCSPPSGPQNATQRWPRDRRVPIGAPAGRVRPTRALPSSPSYSPLSHSWWTDKTGGRSIRPELSRPGWDHRARNPIEISATFTTAPRNLHRSPLQKCCFGLAASALTRA